MELGANAQHAYVHAYSVGGFAESLWAPNSTAGHQPSGRECFQRRPIAGGALLSGGGVESRHAILLYGGATAKPKAARVQAHPVKKAQPG